MWRKSEFGREFVLIMSSMYEDWKTENIEKELPKFYAITFNKTLRLIIYFLKSRDAEQAAAQINQQCHRRIISTMQSTRWKLVFLCFVLVLQSWKRLLNPIPAKACFPVYINAYAQLNDLISWIDDRKRKSESPCFCNFDHNWVLEEIFCCQNSKLVFFLQNWQQNINPLIRIDPNRIKTL